MNKQPFAAAQHGFSIIEIMVGVVIGMIAMLVIYQVFATSEGHQAQHHRRRRCAAERSSVVVHDRDRTGQRRQRPRGRGAGSRHAARRDHRHGCIRCEPIPLLITDGGGDNNPDSFVIYYSVGPHPGVRGACLPPTRPSSRALPIGTCKAPTVSRRATPIVMISQGAGDCYTSKADAVPRADATRHRHDHPVRRAGHHTTPHRRCSISARRISCRRSRYDVSQRQPAQHFVARPCQRRARHGQAPNPLASNIVNMKVQYGIDTVGDGLIHHWVPATAGTAYGDWDPAPRYLRRRSRRSTASRRRGSRSSWQASNTTKTLAGQGLHAAPSSTIAPTAAHAIR